MPLIYLTHRTEDTAHHAFEKVYLRLAQAFGEANIVRPADHPARDVLEIADAVRACDALVVVIGQYGLTVLDEAGNRLLDDPFDTLHAELVTALTDDEKWITVILVDGAVLPDDLPEVLAELMRRDRISAANEAELDAALDSLIQRIGMSTAGTLPEEDASTEGVVIQTDVPAPDVFISEKSPHAPVQMPSRPGFPSPDDDIGVGFCMTIIPLLFLFAVACYFILVAVGLAKPPYG